MIDNLKMKRLDMDIETISKNPYLLDSWKTTKMDKSGYEVAGSGNFMNFKVCKINGRVEFEGSLHKYYNDEFQNHNDFNVYDVSRVVCEVEDKIKFDAYNSEVNVLEFAVNIITPFPPKLLLDNLVVHKGKPFDKVPRKYKNKSHYYTCVHSQFIIKAYDKGLQYDLPYNVLRFEIRVGTMQFLRNKGVNIRYFADLLNLDIYEPLSKILIETFEEIVFRDNSIHRSMIEDKRERDTFLIGNNKDEWKPTTNTQEEWKTLERLKIAYQDVIKKYRTGIDFQSIAAALIKEKCNELCNPPPQIENNLRGENVEYLATLNNDLEVENAEKIRKNVEYLGLSYTPNTRQPENSDNEQPEELNKYWCSGCGCRIDQKKKYHSLECKFRRDERNELNNPINNFRTKYDKSVNRGYTLFDVSGTLVLNEQQKEFISRKLKKKYSNKKIIRK
jgi:hypothetical protein